MVRSREGLIVVEGGKCTCYQWKEKGQCSKGKQCSFRHESDDRAQKPDHNAATPSEPSMTRGLSVSRKSSIRGKSNPGIILRQPCRYYLKGTCTRSLCEYWHPPECQFFQNESGCKAGDKCLFPHHKVDEQPIRKPKKSDHSLKRRESDDKNAVAIVKIVLLIFLAKETHSEIPFAQKVLHAVRFFSQQLISYCITVGVAARNYFQLQLQPRSLHGIIFQFRLQPRSRYGKTVSNDNI